MIFTPRNNKMFGIVAAFFVLWAVTASYILGAPMNPMFILANIAANSLFLAPFVISYVRENGYHWLCLFFPIGGFFIGGMISGAANMPDGVDSEFYTVFGIICWGIACVISLLDGKSKKS